MGMPFGLSRAPTPFLSGHLPPHQCTWFMERLTVLALTPSPWPCLWGGTSAQATGTTGSISPFPWGLWTGTKTEHLSLWTAEPEGLRLCEQSFHHHVMKSMVTGWKKNRSIKGKGQQNSLFQCYIQPRHVNSLRFNMTKSPCNEILFNWPM